MANKHKYKNCPLQHYCYVCGEAQRSNMDKYLRIIKIISNQPIELEMKTDGRLEVEREEEDEGMTGGGGGSRGHESARS